MSCSSLFTTHPANSNLPSITQNALEQRCLFYDSVLTEDQKILQEIQKACQKAEKKEVLSVLVQQLASHLSDFDHSYHQQLCQKISRSSKISDQKIIDSLHKIQKKLTKDQFLETMTLLLSNRGSKRLDVFFKNTVLREEDVVLTQAFQQHLHKIRLFSKCQVFYRLPLIIPACNTPMIALP